MDSNHSHSFRNLLDFSRTLTDIGNVFHNMIPQTNVGAFINEVCDGEAQLKYEFSSIYSYITAGVNMYEYESAYMNENMYE